jgi:hypothetical protein
LFPADYANKKEEEKRRDCKGDKAQRKFLADLSSKQVAKKKKKRQQNKD